MVIVRTSFSLLSPTIGVYRGRGRDIPLLSLSPSFLPSSIRVVSQSPFPSAEAAARRSTNKTTNTNPSTSSDVKIKEDQDEVKGKEEEELPWIQEKALDLVEFTGSVTQAIPGPRVTKNAMLCKSIDELLEKGRDEVQQSTLEGLMQKTGFGMGEILRKYIRYALNEKPFTSNLVANMIQLRKASSLDDSQVAEILNETSRRIVEDIGPVVMDMFGYSEKGFNRKIAVQTLFGKVYYLIE